MNSVSAISAGTALPSIDDAPHRLIPSPCPDKNIRHIIHRNLRNAVLAICKKGSNDLLHILYVPLKWETDT